MISGVSKCMYCRLIFKDCNVLHSQWLLYTHLKQHVTLAGTKIHWSVICKFVATLHKENWIYIFTDQELDSATGCPIT